MPGQSVSPFAYGDYVLLRPEEFPGGHTPGKGEVVDTGFNFTRSEDAIRAGDTVYFGNEYWEIGDVVAVHEDDIIATA